MVLVTVTSSIGEFRNRSTAGPDSSACVANANTLWAPSRFNAAAALKRLGAQRVFAFATHALLSGPAVERLRNSPIEEVTVTNTIRLPEDRKFEKLKILSIAGLMAKAIGYEHSNQSVSSLFD